MPSMLEHESHDVVKMLVAADSGAGKTGALASLVDAGLNLRVLDFDNGLSPLKNYVKDKSKLANVSYVTLRDTLQLAGGKYVIKKADAFQRGMDALDKGTPFGPDVPPLRDWTSRDVLVVDTFSSMGRSCLMMVMAINGAMMKNPEIQHYGTAMDNLEKFLGQITSDAVACHVVLNTHLYRTDDSPKLFPEALGSKLGPKIARYFDNFFSISMTGSKRTIKTSKDGLLALKSAKPLGNEYEIADGYAKIFQELTGKKDLLAVPAT